MAGGRRRKRAARANLIWAVKNEEVAEHGRCRHAKKLGTNFQVPFICWRAGGRVCLLLPRLKMM